MNKEQLMEKFGVKLIDALIQYIAENCLKGKRRGDNEQEVVDGIANKLIDAEGKEKISDYNWMKEST